MSGRRCWGSVRLRRDSWYRAGQHRALDLGVFTTEGWDVDSVREIMGTESARPGDAWALIGGGWAAPGVVGGYVLCCPLEACESAVHPWTHAYNCPRAKSRAGACKRGQSPPGQDSCWVWSGTARDGTLTAEPSLHVVAVIDGKPTGGCGFHGFLRQGVLA